MTAPVWSPGTLYQPGDIVQPRSTSQVTQTPPTNASFESGLTGWDQSFENGTGTWTSVTSPPPDTGAFDGAKVVNFAADSGGTGTRGSVTGILKNTFLAPVVPGQVINFSVRVARNASPRASSWSNGGARIYWLDADEVELSYSIANTDGVADTPAGMTGGDDRGVAWLLNSGRAVAPPNAAFARFAVVGTDNDAGGSTIWFDDCRWDYTFSGQPTGLIFKAVQAAAGFSGAAEPVWPIVNGATVVDNEVTWEALYASRVVWEAHPILVSGSSEPTFPPAANATVADNTIAWECMDNRVKDAKCPNSKIVAIAASKVFAADDDIIAFCATVNPLDWSTTGDAGYLPFGLQTYGSQPVQALGLYRSNLVASNSEGYQMWQVDEDPANMALLDASPVPCTEHQSMQPVSNDLVFDSPEGIRNIGIAGASTNLQAQYFGKAVDPLVKALRELGYTPRGVTWPGAGQYWLIFGAQAVVLTQNGGPNDQSWSRYVFPSVIDAWTIHNEKLYLRSGTLVWEVSADALQDDTYCDPTPPVLTGLRVGATAHLTWTDSTPAEGTILGYRVYDTDTSTLLGTTDPDVLEFDTSALTENVTHHFKVQAFDSAGTQDSNIAAVVIGGPAAPVLSGEIDSLDVTKANLSWTAAATTGGAITGYKLYRDGSLIQTLGSGTLVFQDTGLASDTEYTYTVTATTAQSESADSNAVTLDTGHPDTIVDIFTSDGTWTKHEFLVTADVLVIADGGGGRAGAVQVNQADGGDAGGGGGASSDTFDASELDDTIAVTVGQGGAGGAQAPFPNPPIGFGAVGANGTGSAFGTLVTAEGGHGGGTVFSGHGGAGTLAKGGDGAGGVQGPGTNGASTSAAPSSPGQRGYPAGPGGGSGGGTAIGGISNAGGNGGNGQSGATGGSGGAAAAAGQSGTASTINSGGGAGGGGGCAIRDSGIQGGAGGDGGINGAGGGGGGGFGGAGGRGARGIVIVTSHLS